MLRDVRSKVMAPTHRLIFTVQPDETEKKESGFNSLVAITLERRLMEKECHVIRGLYHKTTIETRALSCSTYVTQLASMQMPILESNFTLQQQ